MNVTTSGGDIIAKQITGSLTCHTSSGNIDGNGIIGLVDASTTAGDIKIELSYDPSIKEYSFNLETQSGDIFTRVPKGIPVNIDAEIFGIAAVQDNLNSDIPLNISSTGNRITGIGQIQNGIIPLRLRATFGDITIEQE